MLTLSWRSLDASSAPAVPFMALAQAAEMLPLYSG